MKTVEQIDSEIAALQKQRNEALRGQANDFKRQAIEALEFLDQANDLPASIKNARTDKNGVFNPRRTFKIRKT